MGSEGLVRRPPGGRRVPSVQTFSPPRLSPLASLEVALRRRPNLTMWVGVLLEALAVATIAWVVWKEVKREDALGEVGKYAWRLGWHDALHDRRYLPLMIAAVVVYVIGSVLIAMRFVRSRVGLLVGVPIAALASAAIVGCLVLIVALIAATEGEILSGIGGGDGGGGGRRKKPAPGDISAPPPPFP